IIEVGRGNEHELRLTALVWAHPRISVSGAGRVRVHGQACLGVAAMTIETVTTGNIERQHDLHLFLTLRTAWPISSMTPRISCPTTVPCFSSVRSLYMCRSLPQMPLVVTLRMASVGETNFGLNRNLAKHFHNERRSLFASTRFGFWMQRFSLEMSAVAANMTAIVCSVDACSRPLCCR